MVERVNRLDENRPKRLSRKVIYESRWFNLYRDAVQLPTGTIWEEYHYLDFHWDSVAVLVENDKQEILFVYLHRYVLDEYQWEIPAGGVDKGETPLEAAAREVLEETGYSSVDHELLYTYYPISGIGNKVWHIVRCRATEHVDEFDQDEITAIKWFTRAEVAEMVRKQEIKDSFSLTALLLYLQESEVRSRESE